MEAEIFRSFFGRIEKKNLTRCHRKSKGGIVKNDRSRDKNPNLNGF